MESIVSIEKRGGARTGAGRKRMDFDARHYAARGINPLMAAEIISRATNELRTWKRLLDSEDDRIVLQAMMFLTTMRDGKPAQSVNITSQNINYQLKDIDAARAIIREIRGDAPLLLAAKPCEDSPLQVDARERIALSAGEEKANDPNLCFEPPRGESE